MSADDAKVCGIFCRNEWSHDEMVKWCVDEGEASI